MGGARSRWVSPKLLASIASSPAEYFDYAVDDRGAPRRELWVDYAFVVRPAALALLPVVAAAVAFTQTRELWARVAGGVAHALLHTVAAILVGCGARYVALDVLHVPGRWSIPAFVFGGGWIAGSSVTGLYLYLAMRWFGRHASEAFSAVAIQDWKNFLRLHIGADGALRIFPVGIRRVPRRWMQRDPTVGPGPQLTSADPRATPPALIERPITVRRR